jgi:uncharacterized protein YbjT (DUF2867 family)
MILVTGATGTVGSEVVRNLVSRSEPVRALVRSPEKAAIFDDMPVEIVQGDLEDDASVAAALAGIKHLFLLTAVPPNQVELERRVLVEAVKAGVEHIVKLSVSNASDDSAVNFFRWHREIEREIEESGVGWTHLRPNNFFQNLLFQVDSIRGQGAFYAPFGEGLVASIDVRDIASVAGAVLSEPGHMGKTLELTGPVALSHGEMARILSEATSDEVSYVAVGLDDFRASLLAMGRPEYLADGLSTLYGELAEGSQSCVTTTVEDITGRHARSFAEFAADYTDAFAQ